MSELMSRIGRTLREREKGSALLVSLMIMVGLSLLGLGFVAISESETAIAANDRNSAQMLQYAEAGTREIVEWFQNPDWNTANGLMPGRTSANMTAFLVNRMVDLTGGGTITNIGPIQTQTGAFICCDKPFKPDYHWRFFGTENNPDIWIRYYNADGTDNAAGQAFLDALNAALFTQQGEDVGHIVDIRIYTPPVTGGTVNVNGFYNNNLTRYGLATIRVTAQKAIIRNSQRVVVAERTAKTVISEWPFPGPQGPVQSNANIQTGGSVVVHWGKMTAEQTMFVKRPLVGLPWMDAKTRDTFEHGYDSSNIWQTNHTYYYGNVVRPTTATGLEYVDTTAGGINCGATEPTWSSAPAEGNTFTACGITWKARFPTPWPNDITNTNYSQKWDNLYELLGVQVDDPWIEARARGAITNSVVNANPQPWPYTTATQSITNTPDVGFSNWFQLQTVNDPGFPSYRQTVLFPNINYDFWKQTAIAGNGQEGVYYLQWVANDVFKNSAGVQKTFKQWTNVAAGAINGFYFFDTKNGQNPQVPGGSAFLTPDISVTSAGGNVWQMSGFIYMNTVSFGTQGISGVDDYYGFPGEPYRDIGFWEVDLTSGTGAWKTDPVTGAKIVAGASDGHWDYQDVNNNGKFDLYLEQRTVLRPDGSPVTAYIPIPYYPGCTITSSTTFVANGCSEPHEPYLNLQYPSSACCTGASGPNPVTLGWEPPATQVRRRKALKPGKVAPDCTSAADYTVLETAGAPAAGDPDRIVGPKYGIPKYCTSDVYDFDGYLDYWAGVQDAPVLNGVMYNEGTMSSQGNARYFGSVLIQGNIDNNGTNEVWFDERLIKNTWPPPEWPFPRVLITAFETDQ